MQRLAVYRTAWNPARPGQCCCTAAQPGGQGTGSWGLKCPGKAFTVILSDVSDVSLSFSVICVPSFPPSYIHSRYACSLPGGVPSTLHSATRGLFPKHRYAPTSPLLLRTCFDSPGPLGKNHAPYPGPEWPGSFLSLQLYLLASPKADKSSSPKSDP